MNKSFYSKFAGMVCIGFLALSTSTLFAQKGEVGFRYMPTVSVFDIQTSTGGTVRGEVKLGFGAGMLLALNISDHFGIQGEVIYNEVSQRYVEQDIEKRIDLKYVNIPLLFSLNSGKTKPVNFNVVAGPQIGLSVGTQLFDGNSNGNDSRAVLSVKKGDLGVAYGAGVSFGLTASQNFRLGLGFRGVLGLLDISDNSRTLETDQYYILDRSKLNTYSGYLGLSFLF